jgi:hypothetical protein
MRKILALALFFCTVSLSAPEIAHADMFGGDIVILTQILTQTISELAELKQIFQNGNDTLGLLKDVNRGINDSLNLARTLGIRVDPGLYKDLRQVDDAARAIETIYGRPVDSPLQVVQHNTDQTVAEAISFNNDLNEYAGRLDQTGEDIKSYSHAASPGGATKLTAESLGVVIHVLNQQLRASGQSLKLQAQALAVQNKKDKDQTGQYLKEGQVLQAKMTSLNPSFTVPRF